MKKPTMSVLARLVLALISTLCVVSLHAQGTITFANNNATAVTNSLTGQSVVVGTSFTAALYWASDGTTDESLFTQIGGTASIQPAPGRINGGTRTTGAATGPEEFAVFQIRVWETAYGNTYEIALSAPAMGGRPALTGKSNVVRAQTGNPGPPGSLTQSGLMGFSVVVVAPAAPMITMQPGSTNVSLGASVTFTVTANGVPAPTYQWRLNGVNLDGETNATLTLNMVQAANAGSYSVGVANDLGAVNSVEAILKVNLPPLPMTNNFADSVIVTNLARVGASSNVGATEEPPDEPEHAGKTGGKSMWITWMAPDMPGIVTFQTSGSSFDTLLAAYTGMSVGALTPVAGDDDHGGFYTSKIAFNTVNTMPGTLYHIAVDGLAAAQGEIVLEWSFEVTTNTLPIITTQPQNQTVGLSSNATFSVMASGSGLSYQWFFSGNVISETMPSLAVTNVQPASLGSYFVRVQRGSRFVNSRTASLQISMVGVDNQVQDLPNADKFYDVLNPPSGQPFAGGKPKPVPQAQVTVQSYTGTQIFRASEASREAGEQQHCSLPGGASWWFYYVPLANGKLHLNTHGSTFDTVLAVYTTPGFALSNLTMVVCDNNSGTNSQTSKLSFQATNGTAYYIVIDGVNGVTGTVYLNYRLLVPMVLTNIVMTNLNVCKFLVTATPSYNFTIQRSSNLVDWTSMPTTYTTTTNGTYNFSDTNAPNSVNQFYRATQTP